MIYQAVLFLFPDIQRHQFRLQDDGDGKGAYISHWDYPQPQPTLAELESVYPQVQAKLLEREVADAVQKRLDEFARARGYDNILSAATYATSVVQRFNAEGQYAVAIRDNHWATCYAILNAVLQGQRPMPTVEEVLAEMPALVWPT
jgi:hypothetical protein